MVTIHPVITIKRMPEFDRWLSSLKDSHTRLRLVRRLEKAQCGNLGDVKPVGHGVSEMREHFGAGWRMYFVQRGDVLIVMLGGSSKRAQKANIAAAQKLAALLED